MGGAAEMMMFDLAAPPARTPGAQPAAEIDNPDLPSFDDHVEAAEAEAAPQSAERARPVQEDQNKETPVEAVVAPPAPQPEAAAPLVIQIIVSETAAKTSAPSQAPMAQPELGAEAPTPAPMLDGAPKIETPIVPTSEAPKAEAAAAPKLDPTAPLAPTVVPTIAPLKTQTPRAQGTQNTANVTTDAATQTAEGAETPQAKTPTTPVVNDQPTDAAALAAAASTEHADRKTRTPLVDGKPAPEVKTEDAPRAPTPNPTANFLQAAARDSARAPANAAPIDIAPAATSNANAAPLLNQPGAAQQLEQDIQTAAAARHASPTAQLSREIVRRFNGGNTQFELRLDPPELGRVEVRLEVTREHRVTAVIAADNPQALNELARGARDLEQALQAAGLELSEDGLSFDLRERPENFAESEQRPGGQSRNGGAPVTEETREPASVARPIGLERWRGVRVDLVA